MTPGSPAPDSSTAAVDEPGNSLEEEDAAPLSRQPSDSVVARADLQRDETVRRWGLVTPSATPSDGPNRPSTISARTSADYTRNATPQ